MSDILSDYAMAINLLDKLATLNEMQASLGAIDEAVNEARNFLNQIDGLPDT